MEKAIIKVKLGSPQTSEGQSFNNDSEDSIERNSFS